MARRLCARRASSPASPAAARRGRRARARRPENAGKLVVVVLPDTASATSRPGSSRRARADAPWKGRGSAQAAGAERFRGRYLSSRGSPSTLEGSAGHDARVARGAPRRAHRAHPAVVFAVAPRRGAGLSGVAIAALALSRIEHLAAWQLLFVPLFFALGNAVEWHVHRDLLHRRVRWLEVSTRATRRSTTPCSSPTTWRCAIAGAEAGPAAGVRALRHRHPHLAAHPPARLARPAEPRGAVDRDGRPLRPLVRVASPRLPPPGGLPRTEPRDRVPAPPPPAPPRDAPHAPLELQRDAAALGSRPRDPSTARAPSPARPAARTAHDLTRRQASPRAL